MKSKGPSKKAVRDDMCNKMIGVNNNMERYTGNKKTKSPVRIRTKENMT